MTESTATPKEQTNEAVELEMRKLSEHLPGKTVTLAPRSAFFSDPDGNYTLIAYDTVKDEKSDEDKAKKSEFGSTAVIQKGWKLRPTMLAIKHGILRVLDGKGKDITHEFGGPEFKGTSKGQPIVSDVIKPADLEDQRDKRLIEILGNTNEEKVMKAIISRSPTYDALERLLQLEKAGENPTFKPRMGVVEGIIEIMKNTSGMTTPGKIEDAEETTVTARRT